MWHDDDTGPVNFTQPPYTLRLLFYVRKPKNYKKQKLASVSVLYRNICFKTATRQFRYQTSRVVCSCTLDSIYFFNLSPIIFIFIHLETVEKRKKNLTIQITQIISYLHNATVPVNLSCRFFNNALGNSQPKEF